MSKFVGINAVSAIIENIKLKFAEKKHIHEMSEIDGLQERLDAVVPPPDMDIENSEDIIIRVNQLTQMINNLNSTIDALIPAVGEIYISTSNENPSLRFGGTWKQIKDAFLLAAGDAYSLGSIGGEVIHTLTIDEMPSHTHALTRPQWVRTETSGVESNVAAYGVTNKTDTNFYEGTTGNIYETGGGQPHNNMPPYIVVSVWERIA